MHLLHSGILASMSSEPKKSPWPVLRRLTSLLSFSAEGKAEVRYDNLGYVGGGFYINYINDYK